MSLPRMSLHIGDYLKDTAHLDATLHGAYLLLIMHYWAKGGLPNDDAQLAMIARMTLASWRRSKPTIQAFFYDGWRHKRVEREIAEAWAKYERRSQAGRKGGRPAKRKQSESNAFSEPKQPITDNQDGSGGSSARARVPLILPEAGNLADEITRIVGYEPEYPPPQWYGAVNFVDKWLRQGWKAEIILAAVRRKVGSWRGSPILSITFFERSIADEHARHAAPLPKVKIAEAQEITIGGQNGQGRNGGHSGHAAGSKRTFATIAVDAARRASEARREWPADPV